MPTTTRPARRPAAAAALAACLSLAALLAPPRPAAAAQGAVVFFGDSLTDNGNLFALSGGLVPISPPYAGGRFSNGPTWATGFAAGLGLAGQGDARAAGGNNFAFGLARTDTSVPELGGLPGFINLPGQVAAFAAGLGRAAPGEYAPLPGTLAAVWAGSNNLLQALAAAPAQADPQAFLQQQVGLAASALIAQLNVLEDKGARDFLVLNVPDLGLTPRFLGTPFAATATGASEAFNAALALGLAALDALPGVRVRTLDVFALTGAVAADPARFGLSDAASPCLTGPVPGIYFDRGAAANACAGPGGASGRVYWDPIHPTAATHALIAEFALAAVPAPAAAWLFGAGLLGLLALRRDRTSAA